MFENDLLESLKIDQSKLKERKPTYVKNVKINIYLDPKAKVNGTQIPVRIDVDKIRQEVLGKSPNSGKQSYYLKTEKIDGTKKTNGDIDNKKLSIHTPMLRSPQIGCRSSKNIDEHQMDYKPKSPQENKNSKRRVIEPLSPISIVSREDRMSERSEEEIGEGKRDFDEESIAAVEKANKNKETVKAVKSPEEEPGKLMRHGTYIVENCGDRVFLMPVIYDEGYTKRKVLMNLTGVYDVGDFWTFWTSRERMDGASLLEQQKNLHQQIQAFDKLLHHAMNKFSDKKMYQMLTLACEMFPDLADNSHRTGHLIPSMGTMRMIYDRLEINKINGFQTEDEVPLMKYLETFFDDLEYLKDLKKYFDQRIYTCLYEYFFDPEVDLDGISFADDDDKSNQNEEEILTYRSAVDLDFTKMTDKQRLGHAIKDMYYMNRKWDLLYKDEELQAGIFDPDSYHEMIQYPRFVDFEYVFRVVPDIFTKAYKSIEIAKIWWTKATEVYEVLPGTNGQKIYSTRGLQKRTRELEEKIETLTKEIDIEDELLKYNWADLESIKAREKRCDVLQEDCEKMAEEKFKTEKKYDTIMEEKEAVQREMEECEKAKGSTRWRDLENVLTTLDIQLVQVHNELKLLAFHYELLNQDLQVELKMRPEFLRYIGTMEIRIGDLEKSLEEKRIERHDTKKKLVLIRTNCEKIREIMEKYLGSRAVSETNLKSNQTAQNSQKDGRNEKTDKFEDNKKFIKERETGNIKREKHITGSKVNKGGGNSVEMQKEIVTKSKTTASTTTDPSVNGRKNNVRKQNKSSSETRLNYK